MADVAMTIFFAGRLAQIFDFSLDPDDRHGVERAAVNSVVHLPLMRSV